jgi:gliding motility-associated-like protein
LWQNNTTVDSMVVSTAGEYWLQLSKNGCSYRDTINATYVAAPALDLGGDIVLCPARTVLLDVHHPSIQNYKWQDNSFGPTFNVLQPGAYWVRVQGTNGCFNSDTVHVRESPLGLFTLGADTTLCDNKLLTLAFNLPGASYLWSNGSNTNSYTITQPGLHWLEMSHFGCIKRDSMAVNYRPAPPVNLGRDTTLCAGNTMVLDAAAPGAAYLWSNGATSASIQVATAGRYWVTASRNGCGASDTIVIRSLSLSVSPLGRDTVLCHGQTLVLRPNAEGASMVWQDGFTGTSYEIAKPGRYRVTITNSCGVVRDEITIAEGVCALYMPTGFTPNRDGKNDRFRVRYPESIRTFAMQVFNRWGECVFKTADPSQGWDGTFQGSAQPTGNFVWTILLTDYTGETKRYKGNVFLIR